MQCKTHPGAQGNSTCNQCGEWLCDTCTIEINGRIFCRRCLAQIAAEPESAAAAPLPPRAVPARRINGFLLFVFSMLPPGVNYMYEGLIKRGLAALAGFFLLIYLTAQFSFWPLSLIFGLTFPVYILACMFDAFNIRRRMNAGETVNDDIDGVLKFLKRNKHIIIGFAVLVLALALLNTAYFALPFMLRRWLPIAVVALGLYMLVKSTAKKKELKRDRDPNQSE